MPITESTMLQISTLPKLSQQTFSLLREFIYENTGIYFQDHKKYLVEGRLGKRLQIYNMTDFEQYYRFLRSDPRGAAELKFFYDSITIKETSFFRNPPQFDAFETVLFPSLYRAKMSNGRTPIRIWSAASSSGEEAYTLAMMYLEKLMPVFPGISFEIIGTDISPFILDVARKGVYRENVLRNMPENYRSKYMIQEGVNFRVKDEVKKFVRFENLNLYNTLQMRQMKAFDIIFCCNVLIYFDVKSKMQVISDLYGSLNRGGYLNIGYAETLHGISGAFKVINFPKTISYLKE